MHNSQARCLSLSLAVMAIALTGCDLFEPSRRNLTVSLAVQVAMPAARLHTQIGEQRVVLHADGVGETSKDLAAPGGATLPVNVALLDLVGDTLASVAFEQAFAGSDNNHWIATIVGTHRPIGHCIGSLTVTPLTAGSDSLFVLHGRIPRDAIC
jgi:hypothetical protein